LKSSEKITMKIQVNTDSNIKGREALVAQVTAAVENALHRFQDHVTRVEVHLSDQNGQKSGLKDKRCVMEARLEGRTPVATADEAATTDQAVQRAAAKLCGLIDSQLGRVASSERSAFEPTIE
jgi:hypothetical protein